VRRGDPGAADLGGAFLMAGARAVILSHWNLELETVVGIAALRATAGTIGVEHLDLWMKPATGRARKGVLEPVSPPSRSLRDVEEATIRRVLSEEDGNRSSAARVLGINRTTLYNKLRLYGIR
jgi:DNA-binding NtrC family response regulator